MGFIEKSDSISRHRLSAPPGAVYTRTVLEPSFRFMLDHYFEALLETNRAWALMLGDTGIVRPAHASSILEALERMTSEGVAAFETFNPAHEYFYSHLENRLSELAGPGRRRSSLARTRPEPLTRMALRTRILAVSRGLGQLVESLLDMAEAEADTVMPQWTHMQPAQPSTLGHYLLGVVDALDRDAGRIESAYRTTNACTLGCGALAGTSYPIDRQLVPSMSRACCRGWGAWSRRGRPRSRSSTLPTSTSTPISRTVSRSMPAPTPRGRSTWLGPNPSR